MFSRSLVDPMSRSWNMREQSSSFKARIFIISQTGLKVGLDASLDQNTRLIHSDRGYWKPVRYRGLGNENKQVLAYLSLRAGRLNVQALSYRVRDNRFGGPDLFRLELNHLSSGIQYIEILPIRSAIEPLNRMSCISPSSNLGLQP